MKSMERQTAWDRLSELYSQALNYSPDERAEFLRAACAGQDALRAEVEKMLAAPTPDGFLEPSTAVFAGIIECASPPGELLHPGDLLAGRFRVERFIGRGGMGEVYAAFDLELDETIALKTLRAEIANDLNTIARFKQEIQISRRIGHPNVCRVFDLARHDWDEAGGSVFFLTMELLEGMTLAERLREGGLLRLDEALPLDCRGCPEEPPEAVCDPRRSRHSRR